MTTEEIVKELRAYQMSAMSTAADRLEELQRANKNTLADLALAVAERTPHDYGLLKREAAILRKERSEALVEANRLKMDLRILNETVRNDRLVATRPEPSRLEIAAGIIEGWASNSNMEAIVPGERPAYSALKIADFLIAAAKEAK